MHWKSVRIQKEINKTRYRIEKKIACGGQTLKKKNIDFFGLSLSPHIFDNRDWAAEHNFISMSHVIFHKDSVTITTQKVSFANNFHFIEIPCYRECTLRPSRPAWLWITFRFQFWFTNLRSKVHASAPFIRGVRLLLVFRRWDKLRAQNGRRIEDSNTIIWKHPQYHSLQWIFSHCAFILY